MKDYKHIQKEFTEQNAWGLMTSINLYNCHPDTIRSKEKIRQYTKELVELIQMKAYGKPQIVNFGEDERVAGYSLVQLIETSLISGHFANESNAVYMDIFSCKLYDPHVAAEFTKEFFKADSYTLQIQIRK